MAASSGERPLAAIAAQPPRRAASEAGSGGAPFAVAPLVARASAATSERAAAGEEAVADRRALLAEERATESAVSRGREARACAASRSSCEAMQAVDVWRGGREEGKVRFVV